MQLKQQELMELNAAATVTANVGLAICRLKGIKNPDPAWFNPYQQQLLQQEAIKIVDPASARILLALAKEELLPTWVAPLVDIKLIRLAASADQ